MPKVSETKALEMEQRKEQLRSQNVRRSMADLKLSGEANKGNGR